jgi:23S rRNA (cytidine2498-2'-O)-methyltransferase
MITPEVGLGVKAAGARGARDTARGQGTSLEKPGPHVYPARVPVQITGYLAAPGFTADLVREIERAGGSRIRQVEDRLVLTVGKPVAAHWAQNVWRTCREYPISTVGDAVATLRAIQRSWTKYSTRFHRRSELIQGRLPPISGRPLRFLEPVPTSPMGSWTLLDRNTLLASSDCSSPFPNGMVLFDEDRLHPPSRAYLKLWELFTTKGFHPKAGEHCVDLGASPGGWTWVLATLGCRVTSVDKAPLDPRVRALRGVSYVAESAFALEPRDIGPVDWLFCDVACYPTRLLALVERWMESGLCQNLVCTLKFQGETDRETASRFAALPGSALLHLWHNGHELTWYRVAARGDSGAGGVGAVGASTG